MNDRRREKRPSSPMLRLHTPAESSSHDAARDTVSLPDIDPQDVSSSLGLGPLELTQKDIAAASVDSPQILLPENLAECDPKTAESLPTAAAIPADGPKAKPTTDMSTIAKSMLAAKDREPSRSIAPRGESADKKPNPAKRNIHGPTNIPAPHIQVDRRSSDTETTANSDAQPHINLDRPIPPSSTTNDRSTLTERQDEEMTETTRTRKPFSPRISRPASVIDSMNDSETSAPDDLTTSTYEEATPQTLDEQNIDTLPEFPGKRGQLVCNNLSKTYTKGGIAIPVLKDVDLDVRNGELLAIIGQSGSGKSTLLHLLATLDAPDEGAVFFDGLRIDNIASRRRDEIRNRHFGMIFQFYHLLPELTTLENVLSPLMISHGFFSYRRHRRKLRDRAAAMLETVGLSHRLGHKPRELSGGEMQRTAIARALINEPDILLADEPTGNLDKSSGEEIMDLLRTLNRERNLTIVMVTHDLGIADQADRTVRLLDGQIVDQTPIEAPRD